MSPPAAATPAEPPRATTNPPSHPKVQIHFEDVPLWEEFDQGPNSIEEYLALVIGLKKSLILA